MWTKNPDDAWVCIKNGIVFAGIVKRVLPEGKRFVACVYDWDQPAKAHKHLGIFKEMKFAQQAVRKELNGP